MKIELSFHAINLKNVAGLGKGISDPYLVVTQIPNDRNVGQQAIPLGKTEVIKNTLNPNWAHVFIIDKTHPGTKITASIYDEVRKSDDKSMGSTIFDIDEILASRGGTMSKSIGKGGNGGTIYVHARESQGVGSGILRLKLKGKNLKNVEGLFSKSDPFFELSRHVNSAGGQIWDNIYRSEDVHNNLNPEWQTCVLELSTLCFGNRQLPIKLEVYDYESSGKHIPMGNVTTTVNDLLQSHQQHQVLHLKQNNKDVGMIEIVSISVAASSSNSSNKDEDSSLVQTFQTAATLSPALPTTTTTTAKDQQPATQEAPQPSFLAMTREFERNKPDALKNDVRMISGCEDHKTSADVSNVNSFQLPDPAGRAGGACTATLLKVLYENEEKPLQEFTYVDVLTSVRQHLKSKGLAQIPQLTSSNPIDVNEVFQLVPEQATGTRRAVLVGINYVGQRGELKGCHNDVLNVKKYIQDFYGFQDEDITILMDDGKHTQPTKQNILNAYRQIVAESRAGDAVFLHYSGHGSRVRDTSGDEDDGYDECLCPVDCHSAGMIIDDQLYDILVRNLAQGVHMVALMDCCHSGTVMDLPYIWKADGTQNEMRLDSGTDLNAMMVQFGGAAMGLFNGLGRGAKRVTTGVGKGAKKVGTGVQNLVKPSTTQSSQAVPSDAASSGAQQGTPAGGGVYIPQSQPTQVQGNPSGAGSQPSAPPQIYDGGTQQVPNATVYVPSTEQPQTSYAPTQNYNPYAQTTAAATTNYGHTGGAAAAYGQPHQTTTGYATGGYVPTGQYNPYAQQPFNTINQQPPPAGQYNPYAQQPSNTINQQPPPAGQYNPYSNPTYGATVQPQTNDNKPGQYKPYVTK